MPNHDDFLACRNVVTSILNVNITRQVLIGNKLTTTVFWCVILTANVDYFGGESDAHVRLTQRNAGVAIVSSHSTERDTQTDRQTDRQRDGETGGERTGSLNWLCATPLMVALNSDNVKSGTDIRAEKTVSVKNSTICSDSNNIHSFIHSPRRSISCMWYIRGSYRTR